MTAHRLRSVRRATAGAAVLTAVLALSACGGQDQPGHDGHRASEASASAAARADHNKADVAFAQGMIPHHRQAVEMSALVADRAGSAEVKELAKAVEKEQNPEIRTMSGWLKSWGEDVPADGGHSAHAGHDMPGMIGADAMERLEKATGEEFDRLFLELMIEHHQGAVDMARTERSDGAHRAAKAMAGTVITSQSAEIRQMKEMLG